MAEILHVCFVMTGVAMKGLRQKIGGRTEQMMLIGDVVIGLRVVC